MPYMWVYPVTANTFDTEKKKHRFEKHVDFTI